MAAARLVDPWAWLPAGLLLAATEAWTIRTGRSPLTALYRSAVGCPRLRWALAGWAIATAMHLHRIGPRRLDPYSALNRLIAPKHRTHRKEPVT